MFFTITWIQNYAVFRTDVIYETFSVKNRNIYSTTGTYDQIKYSWFIYQPKYSK